jgi:hypothetical protein
MQIGRWMAFPLRLSLLRWDVQEKLSFGDGDEDGDGDCVDWG